LKIEGDAFTCVAFFLFLGYHAQRGLVLNVRDEN
jgi:hypothetical protein